MFYTNGWVRVIAGCMFCGKSSAPAVWIQPESVADAVERSDDATRDLPRAERLGQLLFKQAQRTRIDQTALAEDDYVEDD
jgi:hypothetical protein